jgi:AraC-like DNA-binding protein
MIPVKFTTITLPPGKQFEAWHAWYGSLFDTAARNPPSQGFPAKNLTWRAGSFAVSRVTAPAIRTRRTSALIRRNPVDHWVITVNARGAVHLKTPQTALSMPATVPFIISLADEVETSESDYVRVQLYLSRDGFQRISGLLDAARATAVNTAEGNLLADYMVLLARYLPDLAPEDGPRLSSAVEAMVGACLAPSSARMANTSKQIDLTLLERVRRAVRRHLRAPSLGPDMLCREAATSRSQLYRLLEGEGGVAHYIQRQRLSESFALLCDVSNTSPIGRIAEVLCFADASSFSRVFRREFGMSPSDVRASSLAGLLPVPRLQEAGQDGINCFSDCLRGF